MGKIKKIVTKPRSEGFESGNTLYLPESICPCQTARQYKDPYKVLVDGGGMEDIKRLEHRGHLKKPPTFPKIVPTLRAESHGHETKVIRMKRIRRLTPTECERLMSWPDNHAQYGNYDGVVKEISDTQRYKMCGNGIVSKVSEMVINSVLPTGNYRVMSTFSGVDGSCLRFDKRFELVGFSEFDKHCNAVLKHKFPDIPNFGDITKIKTEELPQFDVMFTSPPCQSFSVAGKQKGFADTRGTLFHEVVRILKDHPECKTLIMENVPGLLSHDKGNTFAVMLKAFSELGFELDFELINASNVGVPQNRLRLFLIGKRD